MADGKWLLFHAAGMGAEAGLQFLAQHFAANPDDVRPFLRALHSFRVNSGPREGEFKQGTPQELIAICELARKQLMGS